jgi:acid phosphatase family membrane protein YuiD
VDELLHEHHLSENKLKELLGHTRLEVLMGCITGIATAAATFRFIHP